MSRAIRFFSRLCAPDAALCMRVTSATSTAGRRLASPAAKRATSRTPASGSGREGSVEGTGTGTRDAAAAEAEAEAEAASSSSARTGASGEGVANTASAPRETITTPTTASAASVASRADDENRDGFLFPDRAGRGEEEPSVANATSDGSDASFEKAPSPSPSSSSSSERSPPAESRRRL